MLAWLLGKFRGTESSAGATSSPAPARTPKAAPDGLQASSDNDNDSAAQGARAAKGPGKREPDASAYLEQLASECPAIPSLSDDEEGLVSELVMQVVAYVANEKLEPPTMPALAPRILEVLRRPDVDVAALSRTLEQDQAISAKLLSVANSVAFSPAHEITNLRDAIVYMGISQASQIAIALATRSLFDADAKAELAMHRGRWARMFSHSMSTAFGASQLAAQKYRKHSDEAFLAGLFHDVGQTVALRAISALALAGEWDPPSEPVVDEVLHRVHAFPGAEFYDSWTLPAAIMQVCTLHHQQDEVAEPTPSFHLVCIVSSLDALRAGNSAERRVALAELTQSARALNMSDAELRATHTLSKELSERVSKMFVR